MGICFMGIVIGYVLYFAVRHTEKFDGTLLTAIAGMIGGSAVPGLIAKNQTPEQLSAIYEPYGTGLIVGFVLYFVLAVVISKIGLDNNDSKRKFLASTLLGVNLS